MRLRCHWKWNRTLILLSIWREIASRAPVPTQMTFEIVFSVHFRTLWNRLFDTFLYIATCSQLSLIFEWIVKVKATILRKKHDLAFPAFHELLGLFALLFVPYKLGLDSHRLKVTHLVLHKRCQGRNHKCDRLCIRQRSYCVEDDRCGLKN